MTGQGRSDKQDRTTHARNTKMAGASNKPTLVLIPGSFSPSSLYSEVSSRLEAKGFQIIVGDLPTTGRSPPAPAATMREDAGYFHDLVSGIADEGKDVVLLAHSYGGIVANQSAKGILKTDRTALGKRGGVVRIVFLAAFVPQVGQSLQDCVGAGDGDPGLMNVDVGVSLGRT